VQGLELATRIADIIVDGHGEDILILDLQQVTTITDFFVICTAASTRQLDALQNAIQTAAKQWGTSLVGGRKEGTPGDARLRLGIDGLQQRGDPSVQPRDESLLSA